ncbi:sugar phosphate isomerase/epimerase family protein [Membranihabitans maritimus]|uniref:sugar phosphate isomerase/epimerase family protein n=1 Tax=Membranihabitans maritimus TaxID=2904244 RepID=UPI001F1A98E7|nr:sugar phosphate isomerase/epimerase family protein [Membranihabitans maritimus]
MIKYLGIYSVITIGFIFLSCSNSTKSNSTQIESGMQKEFDISVGVALYSFNRFAFPEALEKSKQSGSSIVEGFFFHRLGGEFGDKRIPDLTEPEILELKKKVQDAGMEMKSMYAGGETLEDWEQQFKKGQQLGLHFLVGEPRPELWDGIDELAGQYGMKLAIHEHARGKSIFWHPDSVLAAIDGHPNFGACGDLGHWVRSGLDLVHCLNKLEGYLISIHAKDLDEFGNIDANDVKLSTGVIDYEAVMEELHRQGFSGPIYIECEHDWENNLEDVKYAVDYIRRRIKER